MKENSNNSQHNQKWDVNYMMEELNIVREYGSSAIEYSGTDSINVSWNDLKLAPVGKIWQGSTIKSNEQIETFKCTWTKIHETEKGCLVFFECVHCKFTPPLTHEDQMIKAKSMKYIMYEYKE